MAFRAMRTRKNSGRKPDLLAIIDGGQLSPERTLPLNLYSLLFRLDALTKNAGLMFKQEASSGPRCEKFQDLSPAQDVTRNLDESSFVLQISLGAVKILHRSISKTQQR